MKFAKDLLVLDFEGRTAPVQVAALLLDKNTLEEKDSFSTYIYADLQGFVSPVSGITQEMINDAPPQSEVGKMLYERFGTDVFITPFVAQLDMRHLESLMNATGIDFKQYNYHVLDVWPIAYAHMVKTNQEMNVRSEDIFKALGIPPRGLHTALEDCRIVAQILRKLFA